MSLQLKAMLVKTLKPVSVTAFMVLLMSLSACGQKRDLFLPEVAQQPQSTETTPVQRTEEVSEELGESRDDG